jgi:inner membrane protein COX18
MIPLRRPLFLLRPQYISRLSARYSLLPPQRSRQFHASPRRYGLINTILVVPHECLVALHTTGLSWAAVIPITAIAIRCIVVPFLIAPARNQRAKLSELTPLISANALLEREKVEQLATEKPHLLLAKSPQALYREQVREVRGRLARQFHLERGKAFLTLLQIPVFLMFAETLRRMMGMRGKGIFSAADAPKVVDPSTLSSVISETVPLQTETAVLDSSSWYDPTMTWEGPLWIMDLTMPDPTFSLPVIVSVLMMANLKYGNYRRQDVEKTAFSRRLHNALMGIAFMIFPLTMHLPAGFLYYWACTSASSLSADLLIDRLSPPRPIVKACRRPLPSISKKRATTNTTTA